MLKGLDLGVVAERQLLKRLGRVKRVVESEAWKGEYAGKGFKGVKGEAEGRVVGRLMGSAPVRECADGMVGRVMDVLGLEPVVPGKEKAVKERAVKGHVSVSETAIELTRAEGDEWSGAGSEVGEDMSSADAFDLGNDLSPNDPLQQAPDAPDIDIDGSSDFSGFNSRIVSSYPAEPDSEAPNPNLEVSKSKVMAAKQPPQSQQTPDLDIPPAPKSRPKAPPLPPSSTSFLPSLMLGGYYSGSESASDIEDVDTKPRKNRKGQRERQKIAEAKFGGRAKHLLIAKQKGGRSEGWNARKGATEAADDRNGRFNGKGRMRIGRPTKSRERATADGNTNPIGKSTRPTGANGDLLGPESERKESVKDNAAAMHPSWEAARKRKEQGSKISIDTGRGGGIGRKITFD